MSIQETVHFDKNGEVQPKADWRGGKGLFKKVFLALVILLVAVLSYGAGRLSAGQGSKVGVTIRYDEGVIKAESLMSNAKLSTSTNSLNIGNSNIEHSAASVYASSKGKRYYFMNCKSTISEANKITFASVSLAEQAGYTLASGCKGQ